MHEVKVKQKHVDVFSHVIKITNKYIYIYIGLTQCNQRLKHDVARPM